MSDELDPYELDDDPFAEDDADEVIDDLPDGFEPAASDEQGLGSDLDQLAAAASAHGAYGDRPPRLGADGRLDEDILCRGCNYNLRGQSLTGTCPECGEPVERSLASNNLRFADPDWLRSLYTGASFLAIGTLCLIPLGCIIGVVGGLVISAQVSRSGGATAGQPMLVAGFIGILVSLATTIVLGFGTWKLCTPEPGVQGTPTDPVTRKLGQYLVLPGYGASLFLSLFTLVPILAVYQVVDLVSSLIGVVVMVGFGGSLFYLQRLAARVPDKGLVSQSQMVAWGLICSLGLSLIAKLVSYVAFGLGMNNPASVGTIGIAGIFSCFVGVGILVFGIWWIVLMFRFRSAFEYALGRSGRGY